jgi:hypothetical protein
VSEANYLAALGYIESQGTQTACSGISYSVANCRAESHPIANVLRLCDMLLQLVKKLLKMQLDFPKSDIHYKIIKKKMISKIIYVIYPSAEIIH